ncbi:Peroxisomal membrane signal receptor PTS1 [Puccinia graminis f. sp. tritici]|uniref:Peroxisomal membrane signal receptor PTS1 n=2 Tax=Puccinia graminis f. sp. tritici TaxID=56615 RepID=A0A5B0PZX9_PUCGR|nr:Peroxisomal membrane signal receptor PTS1 [Puccinia graminis f. sp. tritici]KAA1109372.1 Peroxisomal membrane signal receptor PTS1 [Puccinia graminis f. sp. tritici]
MAFQALINGPDCGPSNPLQNLLKHADRHPLSSRFEEFNQSNHHQHQNASGSNNQLPQPSSSNIHRQPAPFLMNDLKNELESINRIHHSAQPPQIEQAWQKQFMGSSIRPSVSSDEIARMDQSFRSVAHQQPNQAPPSMHWSQQFTDSQDQVPQCSSHSIHRMSTQGFCSPSLHPTSLLGFPHQSMLNQDRSFFSPSAIHHPMASDDQQSKAQIVELSEQNWEAEFAKIGNQLEAQPNAESQDHQDTSFSSVDHQSSSSGQETSSDEADKEFLRSLEATWQSLAANLKPGSLSVPDVPIWEAAYEDDFLSPDLSRHPETPITPENVGDFLDHPEPYPFQSNNPFIGSIDPFEEGQRLLHSGATLSEAALAFEAACQSDESRADAWRMLGETQAADEKEQLAIKAFQRAVGCRDGNGQSAWMSLAICWVNEGQEMRALAILERWLMDTYPAIAANFSANKKAEESNNPWDRHAMVVEKFIQAARAGPEARDGAGKEVVRSQTVDVDVQVGLGVLFYSNSEYERARDCFEAALGVNPDDFLLWNRLGATLANGGKSEEAIGAYQKALELRPTFTRAIYNLGVSCLNIHCYSQAVEHFLAALSFHSKAASVGDRPLLASGDGSENLWFTLRRAFLCLDRSDLADLAVPETNLEIFREHGFDF